MAALQPYQRLLLENRDILLREVRTDDVCPLLFVNGVLTQKEIDEIKIGRSWPERAESLLDLLHYKGEPGFREFCAVLEDTYPHLAAKLQTKNATVEAERELRTEPPRYNPSHSHWNREEPSQPPRTVENWRSENFDDDRGKMRGERQYGRNFNYEAYVERKHESPRYGSDDGRRESDRNFAVDRPREPPSPSTSDPGSRRDADSFNPDQFIWERQTIVLEKANARQGFGIAVSGGKDNPHFKSGDTSIVVSDIVPGSPADGLLRVNDVILQVNQTNVESVAHSDAVMALKDSGNSARLIIRRMKATPRKDVSDATAVTLIRDVNEGYGFSLGQRIFIKELAPNGLAQREATLEPGDIVLKINDKWCDKVNLREAIDTVRNSPTRLDLLVLKGGIQVPQYSTHSLPASYRQKKKEQRDERDHGGMHNGYEEHEPPLPPRLYGDESPLPQRPPPPDDPRDQGPFSEISWKRPNTGERVGLHGRDEEEVHMDRMQVVESQPHVPRAAEVTLTADTTHDGWDRTSRSGYNESISSSPRSERRDMDTLERRRLRDESRLVAFHKSGSLGIQVQGGNKTGIFVAAVKEGSAAYKQGLRKGDQIFVANDIEFKDITREEAVLILLSLGDEVSLLCQYKRGLFDKISKEPGDSFYIKTHFDYEKMKQEELAFQREDVFHVWDTMHNGVIGSWHAQRVTKSNVETETGVIPNKCRAEQLAQVQRVEEDRPLKRGAGAYSSLKRSSSRGGTLKKSKFVSSDHLDEESFVSTVREFKLPAYERVSLKHPGFIRPVVLLGPIADITREKLLHDMPEAFAIPTAFGGTLPRGRETPSKARRRSLSYATIKAVVDSEKHCLLDITPDEVERLNYAQLYPIVIFLKPPNKQQIKEMRSQHSSDNQSAKHVKKLYENAIKLEEESRNMFTGVIHAGPMDNWYARIKDEIKKQQSESVWMSEDKFEDREDLTFQMPNRHSMSYDYDSALDSPPTMRSSSSTGPVDEDVIAVAEPLHDVRSAPPSDIRVRPAYSEPSINFNGPPREEQPPRPNYDDDYRYGRSPYDEEIDRASRPGYKPRGYAPKVLPSREEGAEKRMSLKKIGLSDEKRAEPDDHELQETRQGLRPVGRTDESDLLRQYDERVGAPMSELYAIAKESTQRREQMDRGYARESPVEVVKKTKSSSAVDLEQQLEDLEKAGQYSRVEKKPRPKSESYERQPRNIVVDLSQPNQQETVALSSVLPTRSYATRVSSSRAAEPEVRAVVNSRVESAPSNPYGGDRGRYVAVPSRTQEPPRPKSTYAYAPKPFNADRNPYTDRGSEPPRPGQPVTYNFRLSRPEREPDLRPTTYRTKSMDRDNPREEGQNVVTSDFESLDEETQVVATARGKFTSQGGVLSSPESGVSIVIPEGAIPNGVEQEIYFKVCKDNNFMPPLDADRGETLLSPLVMCGPHGTQFLKPVELRLPHCASMTPDGWSFALKSSDTPTDQPSQWKNVTLQGKDGRPDQCQVDSNSVSVLVDHFSFFSLVGRSFPNNQQSRKRPAKRMLAAVFAVPPRLNSDWLLNIVLLDDTEAAFKDVCNSEASVGRFPFSSFKPILVHGDSGDVKVLLRDLNKDWIVRSVCKQYIEFHHTWEAFREPACAEFMIRDKNFVRGPGVCSVEICQEGHPSDATTLEVTIRPRKVNGDSRVEYLI